MEKRWLALLQLFIAALTASTVVFVVITFAYALFGNSSNKDHRQPVVAARLHGFTLIEMSIVLVIIGLIVGGVLTGQSLIAAAGVRAQISQIEKYNTAAATFQGKYGYLPGDIPPGPAAQFGFLSRTGWTGDGDGNGVIEGNWDQKQGDSCGNCEEEGETLLFWVDLTTAHLMDGNFTADGPGMPMSSSSSVVPEYLPYAKIGGGNFVYVYGDGMTRGDGMNYFGLSAVCCQILTGNGTIFSSPGLTVTQAYGIDEKIDDGLPQSGRVTAVYLNSNVSPGVIYAAGAGGSIPSVAGASPGSAAPGTSNTCFDNGGNAASPMAYSLAQNNGNGLNCALTFRMQAGD